MRNLFRQWRGKTTTKRGPVWLRRASSNPARLKNACACTHPVRSRVFPHFTFLRSLSGVAPLYPSVRPTSTSESAKNDNSRGPEDLRARYERFRPLKIFKKSSDPTAHWCPGKNSSFFEGKPSTSVHKEHYGRHRSPTRATQPIPVETGPILLLH